MSLDITRDAIWLAAYQKETGFDPAKPNKKLGRVTADQLTVEATNVSFQWREAWLFTRMEERVAATPEADLLAQAEGVYEKVAEVDPICAETLTDDLCFEDDTGVAARVACGLAVLEWYGYVEAGEADKLFDFTVAEAQTYLTAAQVTRALNEAQTPIGEQEGAEGATALPSASGAVEQFALFEGESSWMKLKKPKQRRRS